ncbi:rifin [Plasmodium reichenowi]|uniref:Rifin n=1 Tax=Plasmodium reichenowi TaxID=5854 RepID=A0A060RRM2_PLARE|nr:rifin [Plasmodium reichenowi]
MKLHYHKILLFVIPLNILITSYDAHTKNKQYITPRHTAITKSRVLSECNTQSSIYDKDAEMKSVKESFDDRTSQRFEEYDERMKHKRQKRKEERDKNIQKIIDKDKMEKSLAEKIEKGCLRCGCGLGGVAAGVGLFGGLGTYGSKIAALAAATDAGIKKGIEVGLDKVMVIAKELKETVQIPAIDATELVYSGYFTDKMTLLDIFKYIRSNISDQLNDTYELFSKAVDTVAQKTLTEFNEWYPIPASEVTNAVAKGKADAITAANSASTQLYSAIGYSFLAILIIVLVMIIIYLVLRYRRKKKMKKKAQYTKLLNQ